MYKGHFSYRTLPPPYLSHSSPGQEAQLLYISKLLSQPTHPATRQVLSDAFGIPLSGKEIETQRSKKQDIHKRLMPSRTVPQRTALPLINRRNTVVSLCMYITHATIFFLMFNLMLHVHVHACATFNFCNENSITCSICNVHVFCAFNLMVKVIIKLHLHTYIQ